MTGDIGSLRARIGSVWAAPETVAGLILTALAFVAYWLTGPTGAGGDSFVPLADALLHGRLSILHDLPWFELVPVPDGSGAQYSPFPPVPAVTLLPVVALFYRRRSSSGRCGRAVRWWP